MSNGNQKRTRQQRVASVELPPGAWGKLADSLRRGRVLLRLALCSLVALTLWAFTQGWNSPFGYRVGERPSRNIVARIDFEQPDLEATREARQRARKLAVAIYDQDPEPLVQLRAHLRSEIAKLLLTETFAEVDQSLWQQFEPPLAEGTPDPTDEQREEQFKRFRESFAEENALDSFDATLEEVMASLEQRGLLEALPTDFESNFVTIFVRSRGNEEFAAKIDVADVLLDKATDKLQQTLNEKITSLELAQRVFAWLRPRLVSTLTLNEEDTREAQEKTAAEVPLQTKPFHQGQDILA